MLCWEGPAPSQRLEQRGLAPRPGLHDGVEDKLTIGSELNFAVRAARSAQAPRGTCRASFDT
eukprot:13398159-Heterocapsa_arctica.AAC.1